MPEKENEIFENSKIYKFNDCDTVYIPKGYSLQEAIDWYTSEYDGIDKEVLSEVDYHDGFWDCDVPKEKELVFPCYNLKWYQFIFKNKIIKEISKIQIRVIGGKRMRNFINF